MVSAQSPEPRRRPAWRRILAAALGAYGVFSAGAIVAMLTGACGRKEPQPQAAPQIAQTSGSCAACHADAHAAWKDTDHALANRPVDAERDVAALVKFAALREASGDNPVAVLGNKPLWQPLIPREGGRLQPHEMAYDPAREEWFNVFGNENRRPGEWGHWTGRGMNWNSMCAHCHMTGYKKNYDAGADVYRSSWIEHGIGCVSCHGEIGADHGKARGGNPAASLVDVAAARTTAMQTCAPCHARNEALTARFEPGDNYFDHYRVTLPVERGVFWPDGQQREEDFNWTSVLLSKMGHAGVTCMDCHDPHTTKTILPVENNALCQQCHAAPGREMPGGARALPIDPVSHSRHAEGSTGNSCVACHMPTTTYMQRAPRHDHGWLKPDPLLTKELGIPNACSQCHTDKSVDWAVEHTEKWYGPKMDSRQRARARAVDAAQTGKPGAPEQLLALLPDEDIPAWRATLLQLLAPHAGADARVREAALQALAHDHPLVRAAGVQVITGVPDARSRLKSMLGDPSRLVRLDAAWALSGELPGDPAVRKELDEFLALTMDQPAGRVRLGQDFANRGRLPEAEREMRTAASWDRFSPGIHDSLGMVLNAMGRPAEAAASLYRAGELQPGNAEAMFRAGLAYAEAGMMREAETSLREATRRDARYDRAWYNLGLLLSQSGGTADAIDALAKAEAAAPSVADYPYAAATIHFQAGDRGAARAAAERALAADPQHRPAAELLRRLR